MDISLMKWCLTALLGLLAFTGAAVAMDGPAEAPAAPAGPPSRSASGPARAEACGSYGRVCVLVEARTFLGPAPGQEQRQRPLRSKDLTIFGSDREGNLLLRSLTEDPRTLSPSLGLFRLELATLTLAPYEVPRLPGAPPVPGQQLAHGYCALENGSELFAESHRVVRRDAHGVVSPFAGTGRAGGALDPDPLRTDLNDPRSLIQLQDGSVLFADLGYRQDGKVFRISRDGVLSVFAGSGGTSVWRRKISSNSVLQLRNGTILLGDHPPNACPMEGRLRGFTPDGAVASFNPPGEPHAPWSLPVLMPYHLAELPDGSVLYSYGCGGSIMRVGGKGEQTVFAGTARRDGAFDPHEPTRTDLGHAIRFVALGDGTVVVADGTRHRLVVISPRDELQDRLEALVGRGLAAARNGQDLEAVKAELRHLQGPEPRTLAMASPDLARLPSVLIPIIHSYLPPPTPARQMRVRLAMRSLEAQLGSEGPGAQPGPATAQSLAGGAAGPGGGAAGPGGGAAGPGGGAEAPKAPAGKSS